MDSIQYPIIIGSKYKSKDGRFGILISGDVTEDVYKIKEVNSSWYWQGNFSSLIGNWKLKSGENQ